MPKARKPRAAKERTSANVGYEAQLWQMADALLGSMDAAEYKHVVLGLIPRVPLRRPRGPDRPANTPHSDGERAR